MPAMASPPPWSMSCLSPRLLPRARTACRPVMSGRPGASGGACASGGAVGGGHPDGGRVSGDVVHPDTPGARRRGDRRDGGRRGVVLEERARLAPVGVEKPAEVALAGCGDKHREVAPADRGQFWEAGEQLPVVRVWPPGGRV